MNDKIKKAIERGKKRKEESDKRNEIAAEEAERKRQEQERYYRTMVKRIGSEWLEKNIYKMIEVAVANGHDYIFISEDAWDKEKREMLVGITLQELSTCCYDFGLFPSYSPIETMVNYPSSESLTITW